MPTRRRFLQSLAATSFLPMIPRAMGAAEPPPQDAGFKLGTVTYNLAKDWDVAVAQYDAGTGCLTFAGIDSIGATLLGPGKPRGLASFAG